jgi:hypothetical protein
MVLLQKIKINVRVSMHLIFHNLVTFSRNLQAIVSHEEGIHKLVATKLGQELTFSTKAQLFHMCQLFVNFAFYN